MRILVSPLFAGGQGDLVKYWPRWTAVIIANKTGHGESPAVVEVEKWYIKDIDNLPSRPTSLARLAANRPVLDLGKIVK